MFRKNDFVTVFLSLISVSFANTVDRASDSDEIFKRVDGLQRRIQNLETENGQLRKELENQNVSLDELKREIISNYGDLNFKQNDLKRSVKKYYVTNDTLQTVTNLQDKKLNQLEGKLEAFRNNFRDVYQKTGGTPPSFYALLTSTVPIRGSNQTIIYDKTGTNNGNAYNKSTGIFTVPETGTYVFTWTAFSYVEEYVRLEIVVAGTIYGGTLSDTQETGDADTETAIIVANAKAGDEVFIRTQSRGPGDGRLYVEFQCTSTFSGWKIS